MKQWLKEWLKKAFYAWRAIGFVLSLVIILPTFLAAHQSEHFFLITLSLTAALCGLATIIKQSLKKKYHSYIEHSLYYLLIGAGLLLIEGFFVENLPYLVNVTLLSLSAFSYAYGLQRLGSNYLVMI